MMKKKQYKTVIIGFAHMHINDVGACFAAHPRIRMTACADTAPLTEELNHGPYTREWNMNFAQKNFGIEKAYDDYIDMLDREKPDLAIITSENFYHPQIVAECARRGVGVCIEKPMAMNMADALAIDRSIKEAQSFAMVNWPITWRPYLHRMKSLIDEERIGRVIGLQYRAGHTGPLGPGARHRGVDETADAMSSLEMSRTWWYQSRCGGGAMVDLCCYGSLLGAWYTGTKARSVMAMRANLNSPWGDTEDNASMLVQFPGALVTVEGTWTTPQCLAQAGPIVYGETGALTCVKKGDEVIIEWTDVYNHVETFTAEPVPQNLIDAPSAFVQAMDTGEPIHETLTLALNLETIAILDAGIRSAQSGKQELVNNQYWHV
jgi:predicted dehydrogenase